MASNLSSVDLFPEDFTRAMIHERLSVEKVSIRTL